MPNHFERICGVDFEINKDQPAAIWLTHDRDEDVIYIYDEYKKPIKPVINEITERVQTNRLKIFPQCRKLMDEFRSLHRKELCLLSKDDCIKATIYAMMILIFATSKTTVYKEPNMEPVIRMWAN